MSDVQRIAPDREFLHGVLAEGGEDLKKCFQCATCSVVCALASPEKPFPRKEMIWSQWGLKDRVTADPDIWLCYHCNDCSVRCPRGARPGDVMAALRRETVFHYSVPQCLGRCMHKLSHFPLLLLAPAVLLGLALAVRGLAGKMLGAEEPHAFYAAMFPHWLLIGFFSFFVGLSFLGAVVGLVRFWRAMKAADESAGRGPPDLGLAASALRVLKTILWHNRFDQCTSRASRRTAHLAAFYGFAALFVVTVWAVIDLYVNPLLGIRSLYPFVLWHPMKILANAGCAALIAGCVLAFRDRLAGTASTEASTAFDWIFLGELLAVGVTGLAAEVLRLMVEGGGMAGLAPAAYAVYFIHLVLVFALLVYLPYGKFAHLLYRTVALVYAEHTGRSNGR